MSDTKARILKAASGLFLEGGIGALSVRAIAARADMSTIGIYSHFKGKQGILDTLFIEAAKYVSAAMDAAEGAPDAKSAMMAAAGAYLDFAENQAAHYRLFFGETDPDYAPSPEAEEAARQAYRKLLRHTAHLLPADAANMDVERTALAFWAQLHGFVGLTRHAVADHVQIDNWRDLIMTSLENQLEGLLSRKSGGSD